MNHVETNYKNGSFIFTSKKKRSFLVISMITVTLWGLFAIFSLYDSMMEQMVRNTIKTNSEYLSIFIKIID